MLLVFTLLMGIMLPVCVSADGSNEIENIAESMTTEEKIAQMIMPSFRYYTDESGKLNGVTEIREDCAEALRKHPFAGVILFAQNAEDNEKTARLIDAMQKANSEGVAKTQLLIAVDQEGGNVTRLGQGTQTSGNMALGATGDLSYSYSAAKIIGSELGALGFNLDFAPVVDVNMNPSNPVIGIRSFSDDPEIAAANAVSFMKGLQSEGIISTLKHFPGHGDVDTDSHTGLPSVNKTYEELKVSDLVPFQACIDAGVEMIMTAHIVYPMIEDETVTSASTGNEIHVPATLSKKIMTDILRNDMGFEGVIVTDAMDMAAIAEHFGPVDSLVKAIRAGVDIVLMPADLSSVAGFAKLDAMIEQVAKMAEEDAELMSNIDKAILRIFRLKEKHGLIGKYESYIEAIVKKAVSTVGSKANHDAEWNIAKKAITLVKNEGDILPLGNDSGKTVILTSNDAEQTSMAYALSLLRNEGKLGESEIPVYTYTGRTLDDIKTLIAGAVNVITVSRMTGVSFLKGETAALIDGIISATHENGGKFILMSTQLPYDIARFGNADAIVLTYCAKTMTEDPRHAVVIKQYGPNIPAALYLMFSNDESPRGTLPVNIPALNDNFEYSDSKAYERGYGIRYALSYKMSDWATEEVKSAIESGIVPDHLQADYVYPVTRSQVAEMFINLLEKVSGKTAEEIIEEKGLLVNEDAFDDTIDRNVLAANALGIINGTGNGKFSPDSSLTRAQIAAIINRIANVLGINTEGYSHNFNDITGNYSWVDPELGWPVNAGIINGVGGGRFSPAAPLTTEQAILITYRALNHLTSSER